MQEWRWKSWWAEAENEADLYRTGLLPAGRNPGFRGRGFSRGKSFPLEEKGGVHEGAGSCSLVIDPAEQLAAAWFVPYRPGEWYAEGLWNVSNIIWSGLL